MDDAAASSAAARRRQILAAAFDGFVRHGYSKLTLQDVARAAGVSRPLVYTFFKGKEDLFVALFEAIFADQLARVDAIAAGEGDPRDRLIAIFEIVYLELWDSLTGSAEGADLLDTTTRLFPPIAHGVRRDVVKAMALILKDEEVADQLLMSGKGMCYDRPATLVLRARLTALVDIFVQSQAVRLQP